jgi:transcriptional regulator with GAF, ATPase, and Fis domain
VAIFSKPNADAAAENERLRQALDELQVLESIAQEAAAEQPLQETIDRITAKCVECFGVEQGVIHLFEEGLPNRQWRTIVREAGTRAGGQAYRPTDQLIGWALKNKGVRRINDTAAESGALAASLGAEGIRSAMSATLIFQGRVIGLLNLFNRKSAKPFTYEEERILGLIAATSAQIIHVAQLIGELRQRSAELEQENQALAQRLSASRTHIIGSSPALDRVLRLVDRIRGADVDVLITGESGTGKELIARVLHDSSPRAANPFVALNCAALPETLLEAELFGVEKGVATGVEKRTGQFEAADGGTLFLNEIGDLDLAAQAKILRALQERVIQRVGGRETIPVDVRIVAATNKDLELESREGRFRADLVYRLKVIHVRMPALRERREDIPQLASFFAERFSRDFRESPMRLAPDALSALRSRDWPGNIRELQNEIKRLVICSAGPLIRLADLTDEASLLDPAEDRTQSSGDPSLEDSVAEFEKSLLIEALRTHGGNQTETAKALGLSRPGLFKKLRRLGVTVPGSDAPEQR